MNQKIRELAEKSGFFPVPDETEVDLEYRAENARYERFAELIIQECDKLLNSQYDYSCHNAHVFNVAVYKIKKHFGIKDE